MTKLIYEGKAKQLFTTDNPYQLVCQFKNTATMNNNQKRQEFTKKGELNCLINEKIFNYLSRQKIAHHFLKRLNSNQCLIQKLQMLPLEVIIRNRAAGSFAKRFQVETGKIFKKSTFEISYKNDDLGDPLMAFDHALALNLCTQQELEHIRLQALKINQYLSDFFMKIDVILVDFKIEFGRNQKQEIVLGDEFSPDNARLWDSKNLKSLDKDNFRQQKGDLIDAYQEIWKRLKKDV